MRWPVGTVALIGEGSDRPGYLLTPRGAERVSVIALAERLNITTVVTLDRHHFGIARPANVSALTPLP
ncbi:MAG: hypothetical protein ACRDRR_06170 [Pseudonocardiaceae bacterium]